MIMKGDRMYCHKCGHEVASSSSFCPFCGEKIDITGGRKKPTGGKVRRFIIPFLIFIFVGVLGIVIFGMVKNSHGPLDGKKFGASSFATIPGCLELSSVDYQGGNVPSVTMYDDLTCDIVFGFRDVHKQPLTVHGTYEVYKYRNYLKTIACNIGDVDIGNTYDRVSSVFYLCEGEDGNWRYYGEPIGLASWDNGHVLSLDQYVAKGTDRIEVECWDIDESFIQQYVGNWQNDTEYESLTTWLDVEANDGCLLPFSFYGNQGISYRDKLAIICPGNTAVAIATDGNNFIQLSITFQSNVIRVKCAKVHGYFIEFDTGTYVDLTIHNS